MSWRFMLEDVLYWRYKTEQKSSHHKRCGILSVFPLGTWQVLRIYKKKKTSMPTKIQSQNYTRITTGHHHSITTTTAPHIIRPENYKKITNATTGLSQHEHHHMRTATGIAQQETTTGIPQKETTTGISQHDNHHRNTTTGQQKKTKKNSPSSSRAHKKKLSHWPM